MFKKNHVYELIFLDHELNNSLTEKEAKEYKPISVKLIGKILEEFDDYVVVVTWDCPECVDIYRIVKSCIKKKRLIK